MSDSENLYNASLFIIMKIIEKLSDYNKYLIDEDTVSARLSLEDINKETVTLEKILDSIEEMEDYSIDDELIEEEEQIEGLVIEGIDIEDEEDVADAEEEKVKEEE